MHYELPIGSILIKGYVPIPPFPAVPLISRLPIHSQ